MAKAPWQRGRSSIPMAPDPMPIPFTYHARRGDKQPTFEGLGGPIRFKLPSGDEIEIESFVRPGHSMGLLVRGIDCLLDIESHASNTVIVKPRRS